MTNATRAYLARNVAWLRRRAGWSQTELARKAGVSQSSIDNLEDEAAGSPRLETIVAVAGAFKVPHWMLLMYHQDMATLVDERLPHIVETFQELPESSRAHIAYESTREHAHHGSTTHDEPSPPDQSRKIA